MKHIEGNLVACNACRKTGPGTGYATRVWKGGYYARGENVYVGLAAGWTMRNGAPRCPECALFEPERWPEQEEV